MPVIIEQFARIAAEAAQPVLLRLLVHGGVGQESAHGRVRGHVGGDGLHVAVDGLERLLVGARLDERGGVAVGHGVG